MGVLLTWVSLFAAVASPVITVLAMGFMFPRGMHAIPTPVMWIARGLLALGLVFAVPLGGIVTGVIGVRRLGRANFEAWVGILICTAALLAYCKFAPIYFGMLK